MLNPLFTAEEVAKILSIKPQTVRVYSMSGRLPSIKIEGNLRFKQEDIAALIEDNRRPAIMERISTTN